MEECERETSVLVGFPDICNILPPVTREELEKQRAHERYMRLQEQGKTEQARKDLGTWIL